MGASELWKELLFMLTNDMANSKAGVQLTVLGYDKQF